MCTSGMRVVGGIMSVSGVMSVAVLVGDLGNDFLDFLHIERLFDFFVGWIAGMFDCGLIEVVEELWLNGEVKRLDQRKIYIHPSQKELNGSTSYWVNYVMGIE
jgi:hypothetical protein